MALIEWQPTADACEAAALYGATPAQIGDPDTRPVADETVALPAIEAAMRTLGDITRAGTRLEGERDGLLWGFVLTLETQRVNLLKRANEVAIKIETLNDELGRSHLSAETTGMEQIDTRLHDLVDDGERILGRGEAFGDLHDLAANVYQDMTGKAWTPKFGSRRRGNIFLGAAELDGREYAKSIDRKSLGKPGTRIVFSAGAHSDRARGGERNWAPDPDVIHSVVTAVRGAHPDMMIVTTGNGFGDKRIANLAKKNGISTAHIADEDALRRAGVVGHVHFRSPAGGDNEAERTAIRHAIPAIAIPATGVDRIDPASIAGMARDFRPRENPVDELEQLYERLINAAFRLRSEARDEKVLVGRTPAYVEVMEQLKTLRLHRDLPKRYAAAIDSLVKRSREETVDPEQFFRAPETDTGARRPAPTNDLPLPDLTASIAKVETMFGHLREATSDGTQLADERAALMWGVVNAFDRWHERVGDDDVGGHVQAFVGHLKAAAIGQFERITRNPWLPRAGANDRKSAAITYGQQRGNVFRAAVEQARAPEAHDGPIVAAVGPMLPVDDAASIPNRTAVYPPLDAVLDKHPNVAIAITDAKGTNDVVRSWAERHNVPVFVTRINWKQGTKAPYDRNRALLRLPLAGAVHFQGAQENGIVKNLVDLLHQRRIPVMAVDIGAEIREAATAARASEHAVATAPLSIGELCALLVANIDHRRAQALDAGTGPNAVPGYRETIRTAERLLASAQVPEPHRTRIGDAVANYRDECTDPVAFAQREVAKRVRQPADRQIGESQQTVQQHTQAQSHGMRL